MIEIMGYLRQFSELGEGQSDKMFKKQLSPVFWEEGGLQDAAVRIIRLVYRLPEDSKLCSCAS
jgi:hypothetical protein